MNKYLLILLLYGGLLSVSFNTLATDIYVYQTKNGARLITDHPRVEPGFQLIKVYADGDIWNQPNFNQAPVTQPQPQSTRPSTYDQLIADIARTVSIDSALIKSVMHAESAFDRHAISKKGASGLMQLMPETAHRYGVYNIFNPDENVLAGARYLSDLLELFNGDIHLTLAGYNAGENAVARYGGIPPFPETRKYVRKVVELYEQYRNKSCDPAREVPGIVISCSQVKNKVKATSTVYMKSNSATQRNGGSVASAESGNKWRIVE